jgi:hypothetical protein
MLTHFIALFALPLLCVLWVVFQQWLAKNDPVYQGYKSGCGGCTRSCGSTDTKMISPSANKAAINLKNP